MIFIFIFTLAQTSLAARDMAPENKPVANYIPEELLLEISNFNKTVPRAGYGLMNLENEQYYDNSKYYNNVKLNEETDENAHSFNYIEDVRSDYNTDLTKTRRKRRKPKQSYNGLKYPGAQHGGRGRTDLYPYSAEQHYAPSLASSVVTFVTNAMTSIARYDDRQCVARLLCEAASGALPTSLLDRVPGLQPLVTLLSAYSGLQFTPLLVFGRAVLLGASSSSAACRYAHPLCPTDTEELVHYLNNHNGGFFRFFNAPEQGQRNVELFNRLHMNEYHYQHDGLYGGPHHEEPGVYTTGHQYGFAFPHDNYDNYSKIQKRIQNKPPEDENFQQKLTFPGNEYNDIINNNNLNYVKNYLKFPHDVETNYRKTRGFSFPNDDIHVTERNERFVFNNYNEYNRLNNNKPSHNSYSYSNDVKGFQTVYVVRGDGDPNTPEIVHLRPGESVQ